VRSLSMEAVVEIIIDSIRLKSASELVEEMLQLMVRFSGLRIQELSVGSVGCSITDIFFFYKKRSGMLQCRMSLGLVQSVHIFGLQANLRWTGLLSDEV